MNRVLRTIVGIMLAALMTVDMVNATKKPNVLPDWAEELLSAPVSEEFPKADAVLLLEEWQITLREGRRTGLRRRVVRALTEDGLDDLEMWLSSSSFRSFEKVKVWVRDPEGDVEIYSDEDGTIFSAVDLQLLDDDSVWFIDPPGIRPGSIIVVENRFKTSAEIPQDQFQIQRFIPVWKMRITVQSEKPWQIEPHVYGGVNPGPGEAVQSGEWLFEKVVALNRSKVRWAPVPPGLKMTLDYFPPGGQSTFPDWNSTAVWAAALFKDADEDVSLLKSEAERYSIDGGTPIEQIGKAVRKLRYFGIEIGWGGWKPRSPAKTLRRKFGDCKDKSFLMVRLLEQLKIEAVPVLVISPDDGYVYRELPGPFQFNHSIVGIPWAGQERQDGMTIVESPGLGLLRLFDPTLSDDYPGDISPSLGGGRGLAVARGTVGLLEIPRLPATEQAAITRYEATLDAGDRLHFKMQRQLTGAMAYELWEDGQVMNQKALLHEMVGEFMPHYPGMTEIQVTGPAQEPGGAWVYDLDFAVPASLADFGKLRMLRLHPLAGIWNFPVPDEDDPETKYQAHLSLERDNWVIENSGRELVVFPENVEVENELGRVALSINVEGSKILIERELLTLKIKIPPELREEARALRKALRKINGTFLIFENN